MSYDSTPIDFKDALTPILCHKRVNIWWVLGKPVFISLRIEITVYFLRKSAIIPASHKFDRQNDHQKGFRSTKAQTNLSKEKSDSGK